MVIKQNQYDRDITEDDIYDLEHEDLVYLIENPVITDTKNDAPYMYPFTHKAGDKALKRYSDALDTLILDIDYDITIDEFTEHMEDYKWYLYTTYSHTPEHHKFRVIIPLKEPLSMKTYSSKYFKRWMVKQFPYNDSATIKYQGFYMANTQNKDYYYSYWNDGKIFSFKDFKDDILSMKKKIEKIDKYKQIKRDKELSKRPPRKKPSVRYNEKVEDFLSGKYRVSGGNLPFFTALAVCRKANDIQTRDLVIQEAILGGWNNAEIHRKLTDSGW